MSRFLSEFSQNRSLRSKFPYSVLDQSQQLVLRLSLSVVDSRYNISSASWWQLTFIRKNGAFTHDMCLN